jgi:hypothetical protein
MLPVDIYPAVAVAILTERECQAIVTIIWNSDIIEPFAHGTVRGTAAKRVAVSILPQIMGVAEAFIFGLFRTPINRAFSGWG